MIKAISRSLFSLVFPSHCPLCGDLLDSREKDGLCTTCENGISFIPSPHCPGCGRHSPAETDRCGHCVSEKFHFDRAYACCAYLSGVKDLLLSFKFGRKRPLASFFGRRMARFAEQHIPGAMRQTVVPVPMPAALEQDRGFNQSELLGRRLSAQLKVPFAAGALGCRPSDTTQARLGKEQRKTNVEGRFFVRRKGAVSGKNVLLIDDILTTGHTASSCAKALKDAGAKRVTVLAFARGL